MGIRETLAGKMGQLPWPLVILLCLTLGLAPFAPPHVVEKLTMLFEGRLRQPVDWFDFLLHGSPWILAALKVLLTILPGKAAPRRE